MSHANRNPMTPLLASEARLWLLLWLSTHAVALAVAIGAAGATSRVMAVAALVAAYDAIGLAAYRWIVRWPAAVLLYIPGGWILWSIALGVHPAFGLLVFGTVIQAFVFLSFGWAIAALTLTTLLLCIAIVERGPSVTASTVLTQLAAIVATGTTIGMVLFHINRANQDATTRVDLLRRLDAARLDLANQAHRSGVLEERQRLSRDLHDTLAQTLASVVRQLDAAEVELMSHISPHAAPGVEASLNAISAQLTRAQTISRNGLSEIRALVLALRPPELADAPLASAIERVVTAWERNNGITVQSSIGQIPPLETDVEVTIIRALQESLTNVAKHASASSVKIGITCVDDLLLFTIEDDGCGFDEVTAWAPNRFGLSGMRERVRRCGGYLLIDSARGNGTSVTIAVPIAGVASARIAGSLTPT